MPSYRVIKTGHVVEIYEYQLGISRKIDDPFLKSVEGGRHNKGQEERKAEYRGTVNQKARNTIRRLVNANFDNSSSFITLTYAKNMQDIEASNEYFKNFIKKLRYKDKNFKYVAVIEFQQCGAIHYHMLTNLCFTWNNLEELHSHERNLGGIWSHGFVDIGYKKNEFNTPDNIGAYLVKYMTKDNDDIRLRGKKRYFYSRNLIQPEELTGAAALKLINEYRELPPVFTNEYFSDFHGSVQYREYNPKRYDYEAFKGIIQEQENAVLDLAENLFGDIVEVV